MGKAAPPWRITVFVGLKRNGFGFEKAMPDGLKPKGLNWVVREHILGFWRDNGPLGAALFVVGKGDEFAFWGVVSDSGNAVWSSDLDPGKRNRRNRASERVGWWSRAGWPYFRNG